jgi:sterol desaturase/sphingolipid hydroxylase (fatty acid hydroxylase superfamily)
METIIKIFNALYGETIGYLRIGPMVKMMKNDDYSWLGTFEGIVAILSPLLTVVFVWEIVVAVRKRTFRRQNYLPQFLSYVFNRSFSYVIVLTSYPVWVGMFDHLRPFESSVTWYWFIYGFLVFDFSLYVLHWLMHKVRILWCIHSQHHSTEFMNSSVNRTNFFANAIYLSFFKSLICMLLGVNPTIFFIMLAVDGLWVHFSHISEDVLKNGRLGFLNYFMLTPSLHRVHHGRNPLYIDMNYSNLFSFWDRVFGTFQKEEPHEPIVYGITRPVNFDSFIDFYFGEFILLWRDVKAAPTWKDKLLYVVMPPGWHHSGQYKLAADVRNEYLNKQTEQPALHSEAA